MWREQLYEANSFPSFLLQVTPQGRRIRSWRRAERTFLGWYWGTQAKPTLVHLEDNSQQVLGCTAVVISMPAGPKETSWVLFSGLPHRDGHGQVSNMASGEPGGITRSPTQYNLNVLYINCFYAGVPVVLSNAFFAWGLSPLREVLRTLLSLDPQPWAQDHESWKTEPPQRANVRTDSEINWLKIFIAKYSIWTENKRVT